MFYTRTLPCDEQVEWASVNNMKTNQSAIDWPVNTSFHCNGECVVTSMSIEVETLAALEEGPDPDPDTTGAEN